MSLVRLVFASQTHGKGDKMQAQHWALYLQVKKSFSNWKFELSKSTNVQDLQKQCNTNYNISTQRYTEDLLMIGGDRDKMSYRVR